MSREMRYHKQLDRIVDTIRSDIPEFSTISDDDPIIVLAKILASLSTSSYDYADKYLSSMYKRTSQIGDRPLHNLLSTFDLLDTLVHPAELTVILIWGGEDDLDEPLLIPKGTVVDVDGDVYSTMQNHFIYPKGSDLGTYIPLDKLSTDTIEDSLDEIRGSLVGGKLDAPYTILKLVEGEAVRQSYSGSIFYKGRLELDEDYIHPKYIDMSIDGISCTREEDSRFLSDKSYTFDSRVSNNYKTEVAFSRNYREYLSRDSVVDMLYLVSKGYVNTIKPDVQNLVVITPITNPDGDDVRDELYGARLLDSRRGNLVDTSRLYNSIDKLIPTTGGQAISVDDYTSTSNHLPGVCISKAYDVNSEDADHPDLEISMSGIVKLVVAPYVDRYPTKMMREMIHNYYDENGLDLSLSIVNPRYVPVDLSIGVITDPLSHHEIIELYHKIHSALYDYFIKGKIPYGSLIRDEDITEVIVNSSPIIHHIDLLNFKDLQLSPIELPYLGDVEIITNYSRRNVSDSIVISDSSYSEIETNVEDKALMIEKAHPEVLVDDKTNVDDSHLGSVDSLFSADIGSHLDITSSEFVRDKLDLSVEARTTVASKYQGDSTTDNIDAKVDMDKSVDQIPADEGAGDLDKYPLVSDRRKAFVEYYDY